MLFTAFLDKLIKGMRYRIVNRDGQEDDPRRMPIAQIKTCEEICKNGEYGICEL
jgi:hypothetical protein